MNGKTSFDHFRLQMQYHLVSPIPIWQIVEYIAFMSQHDYAFQTVNGHIVALSYYNKINGFIDNTQTFLVKQMLKGLNKTQNRKDHRMPITITLLEKILPNLSHICTSYYEATLFRVAYSISFCALLRVSEIAFSNIDHINHVLTFQNVKVYPTYVNIFIQKSKTDQSGKGVNITIHFTEKIQFFKTALQSYLSIRPQFGGTFLCHFNGSPVTAYQFNAILKKVLEFSGIQNKFYKSHSFRIGGATYLFGEGKSEDEIKSLGRWKSNAYKSYIR